MQNQWTIWTRRYRRLSIWINAIRLQKTASKNILILAHWSSSKLTKIYSFFSQILEIECFQHAISCEEPMNNLKMRMTWNWSYNQRKQTTKDRKQKSLYSDSSDLSKFTEFPNCFWQILETIPQHTSACLNTLQHSSKHFNIPQHASTQLNTLQHAST